MSYMEDKYNLQEGIVYISTEACSGEPYNYFLFKNRTLTLETFYSYHFKFHNKHGFGNTDKHEFRDSYFLSNLHPAPANAQVLYGQR